MPQEWFHLRLRNILSNLKKIGGTKLSDLFRIFIPIVDAAMLLDTQCHLGQILIEEDTLAKHEAFTSLQSS